MTDWFEILKDYGFTHEMLSGNVIPTDMGYPEVETLTTEGSLTFSEMLSKVAMGREDISAAQVTIATDVWNLEPWYRLRFVVRTTRRDIVKGGAISRNIDSLLKRFGVSGFITRIDPEVFE